MGYLELSMDISKLDPLQRELLGYKLNSFGFDGILEEENEFKAYVRDGFKEKEYFLQELEKFFPQDDLNLKWELIEEKNWNELWEKDFQPVTIAGQCHIRASFHPGRGDIPYEIVIDPKMAFGTGHHETTTLMVEFMLALDLKDRIVLDMGCGTGALAILASKMKAKHIDAIDNDHWAYENAKENVKINGRANVNVMYGDSGLLKNRLYNIIFANINRNILLSDIPYYAEALRMDGLLIMSGFYNKDVPALEEKARDNNLIIKNTKSKNNWTAAIFVKTKS